MRWTRLTCAVLLAVALTACTKNKVVTPAAPAAPKYPSIVQPSVPASLSIAPAVRQRYDAGWARFQSGDARGAARDLTDLLKQSPDFYPAETALGEIALSQHEYKDALGFFSGVTAKNAGYLPALEGRVDAALGLKDDVASASALEQLLAADPSREEARGRLELIRLRLVQGQLAAATKAKAAGHLDEAQATLERALEISPTSPVLLRELGSIEMSRGMLDRAEQHARKAADLDASDAETFALLGGVLDVEGKTTDAVQAYEKAFALDPRPAWKEKRDALRARARIEALPPDYRNIPSAPTVTRAQVAAMVGIDLEALVARAPRKAGVVATDVRTHWAAPWILPVTQAGIMDVLPNHTFQPNATVRRSDLAQIASQMIGVLAPTRPSEVAGWRSARPKLDDVPTGYLSYRAIALAVASGAMTLDDAGKFAPSRPATGADLVAMVTRLKQLIK
jgi:tetratricopeptide (TPR) repeat protein